MREVSQGPLEVSAGPAEWGGSPCGHSLPPPSFLQRGWVLGLNNYYSFASQQQKPEDTTIPSTELAKQVIEYARQLEMIV